MLKQRVVKALAPIVKKKQRERHEEKQQKQRKNQNQIHREQVGAAKDCNRRNRRNRRRETLFTLATTAVSTTLSLPLAMTTPESAKAEVAAECTSCSDSNSSLQPGDKAFVTSSSGLRILDVKVGKGPSPKAGDTVVVDWSGYTSGYQAKRIDNTNNTDNQFVFKVSQPISQTEKERK